MTRPCDFDDKLEDQTKIQVKTSKMSRDPSFIYDTSVEAFNTSGTEIDGDKTVPDVVEEFIEVNTPGSAVQVQKFEYLQDDECVDSSELLVDSPLQVTTTLTQQSCITKLKTSSSPEGMDIPSGGASRRLSTVSIESANKISTTPEGEKYFMKREESFVAKVAKGEVETLAVEISEFFPLESSASESALSVRPFEVSPDKEIVVADVGSQSSLTVRPLETVARSLACCSYEHLYDGVAPEDMEHPEQTRPLDQMTAEELLQNLGDKFVGTKEIPDSYGSYEELYQRGEAEERAALDNASSSMPGSVRWSAPVGSLGSPHFSPPPSHEHVDRDWHEADILESAEISTGEG